MVQDVLRFDQIQVPTDLGARQFTVSQQTVEGWVDTIGDHNPLYSDSPAASAAGYAGPMVPPGAWPVYVLDAILNLVTNRPPGCVHARQELTFGVPALIGDTLITSVRIVEKYVKRERRYVVQETVTTNQRDELVLVGRTTTLWVQ